MKYVNVKTIDGKEQLAKQYRVSFPHTAHCVGGLIIVSTLGDEHGKSKGLILSSNLTFIFI